MCCFKLQRQYADGADFHAATAFAAAERILQFHLVIFVQPQSTGGAFVYAGGAAEAHHGWVDHNRHGKDSFADRFVFDILSQSSLGRKGNVETKGMGRCCKCGKAFILGFL